MTHLWVSCFRLRLPSCSLGEGGLAGWPTSSTSWTESGGRGWVPISPRSRHIRAWTGVDCCAHGIGRIILTMKVADVSGPGATSSFPRTVHPRRVVGSVEAHHQWKPITAPRAPGHPISKISMGFVEYFWPADEALQSPLPHTHVNAP